MTATCLSLHRLACERDGRTLFRDLDLDLPAGHCLELRGANGSGKSTLLRAIAGLFPDYRGIITALPSLYLGHRPGISERLTAAENLRWYRALGPAAGCGPEAALEAVGMAGYQRVRCGQLSAGQQRRVGLARLLVCAAPLWLLDEPLTALDAAGQELVRTLIVQHLGRAGAVVCATHQPLGIPEARTLHLEPAAESAAGEHDGADAGW